MSEGRRFLPEVQRPLAMYAFPVHPWLSDYFSHMMPPKSLWVQGTSEKCSTQSGAKKQTKFDFRHLADSILEEKLCEHSNSESMAECKPKEETTIGGAER
jgi:hypothetical protein